MTLIEALKSNIALSNLVLPLVQGIVKHPGSLSFGCSFLCKVAAQFSPIYIISFPFNLFFLVHKSFKNLAYLGTCLIESTSGIFMWTFLRVSRTFFLLFLLIGCSQTVKKGRGICYRISSLKLTLGTILGMKVVVLVVGEFLDLGYSLSKLHAAIFVSPKCFLLFKFIALKLGFKTVWDGSWPNPYAFI